MAWATVRVAAAERATSGRWALKSTRVRMSLSFTLKFCSTRGQIIPTAALAPPNIRAADAGSDAAAVNSRVKLSMRIFRFKRPAASVISGRYCLSWASGLAFSLGLSGSFFFFFRFCGFSGLGGRG